MMRWLLLAVLTLGAGCPKQGGVGGQQVSVEYMALVGGWVDEGGSRTQIVDQSGRPFVKRIIDSDGEEFVVTAQGMAQGKFSWTYNVPSTGYNVTIVVEDIEGLRVVHTSWTNDHGMSGVEDMFRDE